MKTTSTLNNLCRKSHLPAALRKTLAIVIVLLTTLPARADVVFNEENFPDPAFRAHLISASSYAGFTTEGVTVSDEDLNSITNVGCVNKGIASLKGIEHFKNLMTLYCYGNQLAELDLSENIHLTRVECDRNLLTELDLSNHSELQYLFCAGNQISNLDVSGCTALKWLRCDYNQLTQLDLSDNTALEELICGGNAN